MSLGNIYFAAKQQIVECAWAVIRRFVRNAKKDTKRNRTMSSEKSLFVIEYPLWDTILVEMRRCLRLSKAAGEPTCFALEGDKGSGKTTLVEAFISEFPGRSETPNGSISPDIYVHTPVKATPRAMGSAILFAMGDPAFDRRSSESLKS